MPVAAQKLNGAMESRTIRWQALPLSHQEIDCGHPPGMTGSSPRRTDASACCDRRRCAWTARSRPACARSTPPPTEPEVRRVAIGTVKSGVAWHHHPAIAPRGERMERGVVNMGDGAVPTGRTGPAPGRVGRPRSRNDGTVPAGRSGQDCTRSGPGGSAQSRRCRRRRAGAARKRSVHAARGPCPDGEHTAAGPGAYPRRA